ncbi:isoamyl acetate-hydrolyzing esterase 1 homolog [Rhinophrynus dorsalis]
MISWPRIVLFGDSITEYGFEANGWISVLANKLIRFVYKTRKQVMAGHSSVKSEAVLQALVLNHCRAEENSSTLVSLEEYTENLKSMIQYLKSIDITQDRIILITPPPIHEPTWGKECQNKGLKLNRLNSIAGLYAKACVQVARECGTEVVDLWTLMQGGVQEFSVYLSDGLHLSVEGNQFLESHLWPILEKKLEALPFILPYRNDLNHKNLAAYLSNNCDQ